MLDNVSFSLLFASTLQISVSPLLAAVKRCMSLVGCIHSQASISCWFIGTSWPCNQEITDANFV